MIEKIEAKIDKGRRRSKRIIKESKKKIEAKETMKGKEKSRRKQTGIVTKDRNTNIDTPLYTVTVAVTLKMELRDALWMKDID